jgi:8-oxo-dGTP pyrophosphatase MutT (NUDIX family)
MPCPELHHPLLADWPVLRAARRHDVCRRLPFAVLDQGVRKTVGSVAIAHLGALPLAAQGTGTGTSTGADTATPLRLDDAGLLLQIAPAERDDFLAALNRRLRAAGVLRGWRDEIFPLIEHGGAAPLARIERASARFWGSLTEGAHCNGLALPARADAPPRLWLGRRSATKSTDPGMLNNLIGGGVPHGQTPLQALHREGYEEAGLSPVQMAAARATGVYRIVQDIAEGLQNEDIHVHEIELPPGLVPVNQDGEVTGFTALDIAEVLQRVQAGEMTVDASIATLDAAERNGWLARHLDAATAGALRAALAALRSSAFDAASLVNPGGVTRR